jgi:hypothetical protein
MPSTRSSPPLFGIARSSCRKPEYLTTFSFVQAAIITAEAKLRRQYSNGFVLFFHHHHHLFFLSDFWRTTQQNLRKPSSSHFQELKSVTYHKNSFSPFEDENCHRGASSKQTAFRLHNSAISQPILMFHIPK